MVKSEIGLKFSKVFILHSQSLPLALDTPDGIKNLRELILTLAMQGKLVEQDPSDQPAGELLKEIESERKKLQKEGKIKKIEQLLAVNTENYPFEKPNGWEFVRLGDVILSITGGGTPDKNNSSYWNGDIPWASVKDLNSDLYLDKTIDSITELGVKSSSTNIVPVNSVIVCTRMGLGKIVINKIEVAINQDLKALLLTTKIDQMFFFLKYKNYDIQGSGMTVKGIRQDELLNFILPLPPLAEQKRIVAKIDELMALCDTLEKERDARNAKRRALHTSAMNRMFTAPDKPSFDASWQFITKNFKEIYSVKENVAELKKSILQLAVMGKLVPQDKKDQPAGELLKDIEAEKKRLLKEGKIKKIEQSIPITPDELCFEIPSSWEFVRMQDIAWLITDGTHLSPKYVDKGRIFLSAQNVKPFKFMPDKCRYVSEADYQGYINNRKAEKNDILLTRVGSNIGEAAKINQDIDFAFYVSLGLLKFSKKYIFSDYIVCWLNSPDGSLKSLENTLGKGASQGNLNLSLIRKFVIPLPPLAEQKRIVAKVDELMALCDELAQGLDDAEIKREKILNSVMNKIGA